MIMKLSWSAFKATKDANPSETIYYEEELEYHSNDPYVADIERYFLDVTVGSTSYQCFVPKTGTPAQGSDEEDWVDNYKSSAVLR